MRIRRTEHTVALPYLPPGLSGLRVAHLTDLHRSRLTSDHVLREAVALANAAEPDLTVITGDFVSNDRNDIDPCARIVCDLRARLGVFAVLGNHDYYTDAPRVLHALAHVGVKVLVNQSVCLEGGLHLVGLDEDRHGKPNLAHAFAGLPSQSPALVLLHNPAFAEKIADRACVALAGHTHGGQVRVPILTAREVRRIGAKHYRAGWFTLGKTRLYVNQGLGQVGLPLRLFCHPEVAFLTLVSAP